MPPQTPGWDQNEHDFVWWVIFTSWPLASRTPARIFKIPTPSVGELVGNDPGQTLREQGANRLR